MIQLYCYKILFLPNGLVQLNLSGSRNFVGSISSVLHGSETPMVLINITLTGFIEQKNVNFTQNFLLRKLHTKNEH